MPRRNESNLEMILRDLTHMPWWASVLVALFVFIMSKVVAYGLLKGPMFTPLGQLLSLVGTLLAILFLVPGVISFVRSRTTHKDSGAFQRSAVFASKKPGMIRAVSSPDDNSRQSVFRSEFEKTVYEVARELWPSCLVLPNAALQSIFKYEKMRESIDPELFSYYLKSMVDISICNPVTGAPQFAIEVDSERYHGSDGARLRDKKKDDIFRAGGVPLIRLRMNRMIERSVLKEKLLRARESLNDTVRQVSIAV